MTREAENQHRFESICVVGLGGHAKTKLVPAVVSNGQRLVGVVTSQAAPDVPAEEVFRTLEEAALALPPDTLYVVATPPHLHHAQVMALVSRGRSVLVEKPAFERHDQAVQAFDGAAKNDALLVEGFMHRHTDLYTDVMLFWNEHRSAARSLTIEFTIPALPPNTFRNNQALGASVLYDIGCYALSLMSDFGLPLDEIKFADLIYRNARQDELIVLSGNAGNVELAIRVGVDEAYSNKVSIDIGGQISSWEPFFYGRRGERRRTLVVHGALTTTTTTTTEPDAFARMLAVPTQTWRQTQATRAQQTIDVTASLERLSADLQNARNSRKITP